MDTKTTIPITEARKKIFAIVDEIQHSGIYYTFTKNGRPKAVMISAKEFESWHETLEVMRDMPDLDKDIKELKRDLKSGAYKRYPTLEEVFAKNHAVSHSNKTQGAKRSRRVE